jgi:hypothetical protein
MRVCVRACTVVWFALLWVFTQALGANFKPFAETAPPPSSPPAPGPNSRTPPGSSLRRKSWISSSTQSQSQQQPGVAAAAAAQTSPTTSSSPVRYADWLNRSAGAQVCYTTTSVQWRSCGLLARHGTAKHGKAQHRTTRQSTAHCCVRVAESMSPNPRPSAKSVAAGRAAIQRHIVQWHALLWVWLVSWMVGWSVGRSVGRSVD